MLALFKVRYRSFPGWTDDNRAEPEGSLCFGQGWIQVPPRHKYRLNQLALGMSVVLYIPIHDQPRGLVVRVSAY